MDLGLKDRVAVGIGGVRPPIRRFGTIEGTGGLLRLLCPERASCAVGATNHVDGGMLRTI